MLSFVSRITTDFKTVTDYNRFVTVWQPLYQDFGYFHLIQQLFYVFFFDFVETATENVKYNPEFMNKIYFIHNNS